MSRFLVLTADLPYFPGKMGVDFFNIRHLARTHRVGLVSLCHPSYPRDSVANLERLLERAYLWPRAAAIVPYPIAHEVSGDLPAWLARAPRPLRSWLLRRILGIHRSPREALEKLVALAHCAPNLLEALSEHHWDVLVLIQSSLEPWLAYLPAGGARFVYFHDVRADYLRRAVSPSGCGPLPRSELAAIERQEQRITEAADVVAFVSQLDLERARRLFRIRAQAGVAPVPVDTTYFTPMPPDWARDPRPIVLFTGHLSHPPNVDAVLHFVERIWPRVLKAVPTAVFHVAGMLPAAVLEEAVRRAPQCELHANVPDIRPLFWNARVYVVPMRFGGGVRQKLFEAWSMDVPVVCSAMAAEGTPAQDGVDCFIANDAESFADEVAALLKDPRRSSQIVGPARRLAKAQAVENIAPCFEKLVLQASRIRRSRPFKVLYDLRWMELGRAGGIEQAAYELLSGISQVDRQNEYRLLAPRSACWEWDFPRAFRVSRHYSDSSERNIEAHRSFIANRLAESVSIFPLLTPPMRSLAEYRRLDFDLVHSVAGFASADMRAFPGILTINDLQHLQYPDFFGRDEWEERERLYRTSASEAKQIICISEFTRQDVHRRYGVALEKLTTIWLTPSRAAWQGISEGKRQSLLAAMGVRGRFLLFPAHCWPHKNHASLVEAFIAIESDLPGDISLVMTGRPFPEDHRAAMLIRKGKPGSRIVHLGYRSSLEMRALLQSCHALVYPSLFEGFGMPVAEAIIAGKPVACSNVTSLPEIAGDAALMFDPLDVREMARSILDVATDAKLRASLVHAALRRRALFSALENATRTLAIYAKVFAELYGGDA